MKKLLILTGYLFAANAALCQGHRVVDKVRAELAAANSDSARISGYIGLAGHHRFSNKDSALYYANKAIKLSELTEDRRGEALSRSMFGFILLETGDIPAALQYQFEALRLAENIMNRFIEGLALNRIGNIYMELQDHRQAIDYYTRSQLLFAKSDFKGASREGWMMNEISNIGNIYEMMGMLDSAKILQQQVFAFSLTHNDRDAITYGELRERLGNIEFRLKNYDSSLMHYRAGIPEALFDNDIRNLAAIYLQMSRLFFTTGKYDSAFLYANKTIESGTEVSWKKAIWQGAEILAAVYKRENKPAEALRYTELAYRVKDSLYGPEQIRQLQLVTLKEQQRQQKIIDQKEASQSRYRLLGVLFAFLILLAGSILLWRNNKQRKKTNAVLLAQKNQLEIKTRLVESHNRNLEIEASLERVRTKTMAMHNSADVADTAVLMFKELEMLGVKTNRSGILIFDGGVNMEVWTAATSENDKVKIIGSGQLDCTIHPMLAAGLTGWKNKEERFSYHLQGDEVASYYNVLKNAPGYPFELPKQLPVKQSVNIFYFPEGGIFTFTTEELPESAEAIFKRFAGVFALTYRRFLDLQKAEQQLREGQIEASLEKVRSRTLAMHKTTEMHHVVTEVMTQLQLLGFTIHNANFNIIPEKKNAADMYLWVAVPGKELFPDLIHVPYFPTPMMDRFYNRMAAGETFFTDIVSLDEKNHFFKHLYRDTVLKNTPDERIKMIMAAPGIARSIVILNHSALTVMNYDMVPCTEEQNAILKRIGQVFDQAYTRFLDLQKAEVQASEARKQASLDRVRGQISGMRSTKDLDLITPLIWKELTTLAIPFIRCGVFIVDESTEHVISYLSTPDGRSLGRLKLAFDSSPFIMNAIAHWRNKEVFRDHWDKERFVKWMESMLEHGQINNLSSYQGASLPPDSLYLHLVPFAQGMIYVGNTEPLTATQTGIVTSLAEAFSMAYARYDDFNKLESAKKHVERALTRLKDAQTQLVQSEKMASLGELTAGIAHEIQNPLNFVNNFSEVNTELTQELENEINRGDIEEARSIAADIRNNSAKILEHGRRADSIVKNMLQHSRSGTGEKNSIDLNGLLDEYLRLSYHGLRAKDKTFNCIMETHFDPQVGKVSVMPQDFGRVFLNLFNNAFYSMDQKKKKLGKEYEPVILVSTVKQGNEVLITVKDNGTGIPQKLVEKIYQPFFTTKPTGEGTGLGLSLSYDIITKGHGGQLKVNTSQGEYAEFLVSIPDLA